MTSPEPINWPTIASSAADPDSGTLRTELLHRHLVARVAAARRQVEELEELTEPGASTRTLVASVGATVAEARRSLSLERADAELRVEAFERAARRRGAELLAEAEAEARVLQAAAAWLRQARLAGPASSVPAPLTVAPLALAAVEARAS